MFTENDFLGGKNCTSCGRPVRVARPGFDATPDRCLECSARLTGPPPAPGPSAPGPARPVRSKEIDAVASFLDERLPERAAPPDL